MYNKNLFIEMAANAVQLIATCEKALADQNQKDKVFWIDSKNKAFELFSNAMRTLGMTSKISNKVINMNHDEVASYLNHRLNSHIYYKATKTNSYAS